METTQQRLLTNKPVLGLVAAYGTLRIGNGNWRGYLQGDDRSRHLGTFKTLPMYTMYGKNSGFPMVSDIGETSIVYDLFEVYDERSLRGIDALEGCRYEQGDPRNWYDFTMIDTPYGKAKMYVMHFSDSGSREVIESGDWEDRNQ